MSLARLRLVGMAALLLAGAVGIAVLAEGGAAGRAAKPPHPPSRLWYHFVVAARLSVKSTQVSKPPEGEIKETSVRETSATWYAASKSATILTHGNEYVSLAAGMRGFVTGYSEDLVYKGFYTTLDPTNTFGNPLKKPCRRDTVVSLVRDRSGALPRFFGLLVGEATAGFKMRLYGSPPRASVVIISVSDCSEHPTPSEPLDGIRDVILFPATDKGFKLPSAAVRFGRTLSFTVTRHPKPVTHDYGSDEETTETTFQAHVTFFRCPGSTPCENTAVPDDAFDPPPEPHR